MPSQSTLLKPEDKPQKPAMPTVENSTDTPTPSVEMIRCPNCGSHGERHYLTQQKVVQTQCPSCDYLMVNCLHTGSVVEAYAPGIPML
ncbi:hypothetical protein PN462_00370 [Spirulina sp. CS-785/01]|uniref:hypothetical protein n=1 Tax=Spirulina sp. CS-785/01 TaxID=3021716 RepID=UPI00232BCAED|nr:hypothetical protein [Spirulina sp. CS-785/01]MDB9311535.1 hypothetical protein [Spirulina sp. CS-785/01]